MDFHSLSRKELQTLCKKNKIPANITNVAMADALKSLQFVEGIEEFSNPSESVTAQSSIESPDKSEVTSPCVPRTGGRTTRRKTVKDDVENSQTMTRARRSTRKSVVGEVDEKSMVETPAVNNSRRVPVASVRRKMDIQLKELEEDKKIGNEDASETPGVLPSSRRRGLMGENTVSRTYGTRRSARLAGKNSGCPSLKENGKLETVKSELFSEEFEENLEILEMNVKGSSDDLGEIIQSADVELKEELEEEGLETNNVKEVNAANGLETVVHSEVYEEKDHSADTSDKPLGMHDDDQEKSGGGDLYLYKAEAVLENGNELDANLEMVPENVAAETIEAELISQDDAFTIDKETLQMSEEKVDAIANLSVVDQVLENAKMENDMGFQDDGLANDLEANKYSEDLAAFDINCGGITKEDGFYPSLAEGYEVFLLEAEEQDMYLVSVLESMTLDNSDSLEEEHVNNNLMEETTALEFNATANLLSGLQSEETAKSYDVEETEKSPTEQLEIVDKTYGLVSVQESMTLDNSDSFDEEEGVNNNLMEETTALELNATANLLSGLQSEETAKSYDVEDSEKSPTEQLEIVDKTYGLVSVQESMTLDNSDSLDEERVNNKMMEEATALELNATANLLSGLQSEETAKSDDVEDSEKSPSEQLEIVDKTYGLVCCGALPVHIADDIGEASVFNLTTEPSKILTSSAETELSHSVLPTSLTPSKKSASKTPLKKSASKKTPATTKKLSHVFDDKENIDNSGTKLMLTKEEKKKKDFGLQAQYVDVSLRKLKKELKEKLESSKQVKKDEQVMSSRPALQAVSENIVGE